MTDYSKVAAILPLRSGSKRVQNKNIRKVGYYPLFYHIIKTCLDVDKIDLVIVSVDCDEYKDLVEKYFPGNPKVFTIIRPAKFASDSSKSEDAMLHAVEYLELNRENYGYLVLVQATTPLTQSVDISTGIDILQKNPELNSAFSVCESKRFYLDDINTLLERPMTQDKKPRIHEVGCFWCVKIGELKKEKNRIVEPYAHVPVREIDSLDIDTEDDMFLVDVILSKKIREDEKRYYTRRYIDYKANDKNQYYGQNTDPDGNVRNILLEKENRIAFAKNEIEFINELILNTEIGQRQLLSIGCGGGYAEATLEKAYIKHGVEPDLEAYKIAKKSLDFVKHGVFNVKDYEQDFFDVVFCHHVIEHVEDPIPFIKNIRSILKPGGMLIIGTPNFDGAMARKYNDGFRLLHDPTHISLFSDFSLKELLEDNLFLVNYIDYPYFDTKYFCKEEMDKLFSDNKISPPFYGNICTLYAEKK